MHLHRHAVYHSIYSDKVRYDSITHIGIGFAYRSMMAMVGWDYTLGPIFPKSNRMASYTGYFLIGVF